CPIVRRPRRGGCTSAIKGGSVRRVLAVGTAALAVAATAVGVGTATAANGVHQAGALAWGKCPAGVRPGLQCATVRVPVAYARPGGTKLPILVSRAKATGTAQE